jgi:hypothetical protein
MKMDKEQSERPFEFISTTEIHKIQPGDKIEVTFCPNSQKHFFDPEFDYYFPTYNGTVISSNHTVLGEIILEDPFTKKTFPCEDRAGTSATTGIKRFLDK